MTANEAQKYLDGLGVEKYLRIMKLISRSMEIVDTQGNSSKILGIVQENMDSLRRYFKGELLEDQRLINLASFLKGLLGEEYETAK